MSSLKWLRRQAVAWALPPPFSSVSAAMSGLGFVQADPIRAPARAQDLILRHRVRGYRAGDLERRYRGLDVDEDWLYAYGFVSRELRGVLQPRRNRYSADGRFELTARGADILAFVSQHGVTHPRLLQDHFGAESVVNAWGGASQATTVELDRLQRFGFLRVADRVAGIRRYEIAPAPDGAAPAAERLRRIALRIATTLAPVPMPTLTGLLSREVPGVASPHDALSGRGIVTGLLASGELEASLVEGTRYLWPAGLRPAQGDAPGVVKILAPFDPLVWDRRRFAHLWDWQYRFEAYTPPAKRQLGYYAMPLLWRDAVIGWVTCGGPGSDVDVGYVGTPPRGARFASALDAELTRLRTFLGPAPPGRLPTTSQP